MKNKALFYILSFTWGIIMTLTGLIVAGALICTGHKPKPWGRCLCFNVGKNWGGVSLGIVIITDSRDSKSTKKHEHGHALQNCKYGPLMPLFSLCSAGRYWYRRIRESAGLKNKTDYDAFWLEAEATALGKEYFDFLN